MSDENTNDFAKQFIASWQDNFAKAVQDPEIMLSITQAMGFMQQFYEKPFTNSATSSYQHSANEPDRQQLLRRVEELEQRIAKLEKARGGSGSKKKTS